MSCCCLALVWRGKGGHEYVKRKESKNKENQKIQNLEEDLASIKGDIDEIKNLLRSLINGS